eukprot:Protomagalhaensia_wolfi_Nauph_80__4540@NODE_4664_length_528_cov_20_380368_g3749_i0_p1_GENE_NODE_4664_length_528_cov_20_380368_g3749_i0NODE_4664_length_528_cov_20_380368_g3749_i0_p1_ORF_typecomplete_len135_score12_75Fungal_trans_2/PF11951_8/0_027_NODE_4664_length_528_cov_20_380368_g3749_i092496
MNSKRNEPERPSLPSFLRDFEQALSQPTTSGSGEETGEETGFSFGATETVITGVLLALLATGALNLWNTHGRQLWNRRQRGATKLISEMENGGLDPDESVQDGWNSRLSKFLANLSPANICDMSGWTRKLFCRR